jgi:hypothetical protein
VLISYEVESQDRVFRLWFGVGEAVDAECCDGREISGTMQVEDGLRALSFQRQDGAGLLCSRYPSRDRRDRRGIRQTCLFGPGCGEGSSENLGKER